MSELWQQIVLRPNGINRALWDAGATVNAGIRIDIEPGPLCFWLAGYDALYRANFYACAIANAQIEDNVRHDSAPL
jgi:hypothetical protein